MVLIFCGGHQINKRWSSHDKVVRLLGIISSYLAPTGLCIVFLPKKKIQKIKKNRRSKTANSYKRQKYFKQGGGWVLEKGR